MKKYIFLALFFCFVFLKTTAQNYSFINYSTKHGLAQSQVFSIAQDHDNYLWIATLDGLSRFNGKKFTNFYEKNGLLSNRINQIYVDKKGCIWLTSSGGITLIKKGVISQFPLNNYFEDKDVKEVLIRKEKLWVSTKENGLFLFETNEDRTVFKLITVYYVPGNDLNIKDIHFFGSALLLGTNEGVYKIKDSIVTKEKYLNNYDVSAISENSKGELWISTLYDGIYKITGNNVEKITQENSNLPNNYINNLYIDKKDVVWTSSNSTLSEITSKNKIENYTSKNGFDYISQTVFEDKEGNIWIGTNGKGLVKFTNKEFLYLTKKQGLHSDAILTICEDKDKSIWLGSYGEGICEIKNDKIKSYNARFSAISNNNIWASYLDRKNNLWFGTSDGLMKYSGNKFITYTIKNGLPSNKIQSFYQEKSDVLWIGTKNGVVTHKNGVFTILDSFPYRFVRSINTTQDGIYWFGTSRGLVSYDGFEVRQIQDSLLLDISVYTIQTYGNKLWIGTENGLVYFDGEKYLKFDYTNDENIPSSVNFLLIDTENYLWIGTNKGVFTLNLTSFYKGEKLLNSYNVNNGLTGMETNLNSIYQDNEGKVWFGTSEGVNIFKRDKSIVSNTYLPSTNISKVNLHFGEKNWLNEEDLVFSYKKNSFTFQYNCNYFKDPSKVKYSYKLIGQDDVWSPMQVANFTRYSNLKDGKYTFKVKATMDGKNWSNIDTFEFEITPPFWLTWTFRIVFLLGFLIVGFWFYNRRIKARKKQREIELLNYQNKLIKLEQQSLNASMNRHFIFNSLNSIQFYINKEDKRSANKYLTSFSKLIRKNLDSSSPEDSLIPLSGELERLELYLTLENMRFKDKFTYEINVDKNVDTEMTRVPGMFMQPFVENSIWHGILPTEKPGKITINVFEKDNKTHFEIMDNGIGIETSKKKKEKENSQHTSQGMRIAANRIELLQKVINKEITVKGPYEIVENGEVKGTKVEIVFS